MFTFLFLKKCINQGEEEDILYLDFSESFTKWVILEAVEVSFHSHTAQLSTLRVYQREIKIRSHKHRYTGVHSNFFRKNPKLETTHQLRHE